MANEHDLRYKKLFSNPTLVKELFLFFVDEEFVADLDFSRLERLDKSFISDEFKERESDVIYKIPFQGKDIYIYLLIEFQSTVDRFMALRILRYILELYEFLIQFSKKNKDKQKDKPKRIGHLPAVFPVLLYNGEAKWTAKFSIHDLIRGDIPEKYIPHFSYYPIIEHKIPKSTLLTIKNAVSAVFYVENSTPEELQREIKKVMTLLEKEHPEIIKLFRNWLNNLLGYQDEELNREIDQLIMEADSMFEAALKRYGEKIKQDAIQEGKLIEKQNILMNLLWKKFSLTEEEKKLIQNIHDSEKLDQAIEKILFAKAKEEIFASLN